MKKKIKFPDNIENRSALILLRDIYRKVRAFCSFEERLWLITGNEGDLEIYAKKLRKMAEKYDLLEK